MLGCIWSPYLNLLEPWDWVAVIRWPTGAQLSCPCMVFQPKKTDNGHDVSSSNESRQVCDCQPGCTSPFPLDSLLMCSATQEWVNRPGVPSFANSGHSPSPRFLMEPVSRLCSILLLLPTARKTRMGQTPKIVQQNKCKLSFLSFLHLAIRQFLSGDDGLHTLSTHHQAQKGVVNLAQSWR